MDVRGKQVIEDEDANVAAINDVSAVNTTISSASTAKKGDDQIEEAKDP